MFFRTMLRFFLARFGPRLGHYDVARTNFITLPTDQDILKHMNNGVYFSIMDVARFDMLVRNGIWQTFKERGWYPVVASETITFRKSLTMWQRFTIESRIVGYDEKAAYLEQRFVRPGADGEPEIYAQGFIRARFLKRSGGTVSMAELIDAVGVVPEELELPEWMVRWGQDVALPPTRAEAPSLWP